ncbi:MAG: hypothetical protein AB8B83_02135 [Bdellovibrionales bacterium]
MRNKKNGWIFYVHNISVIIPLAPNEQSHHQLLDDLKDTGFEIITLSEGTRAKSLNKGAEIAKHNSLWFLHADSRVSKNNLDALNQAIKQTANTISTLHYFNLTYRQGGVASLNAIGANLRSCILGLPYGDQGFCMSKDTFKTIGNYPDAPYGEDVLFIRKAKRNGVKLNRIASKLSTCARKYHDIGWLKLTVIRQIQILKLIRQKI